jgi:outer membrane protein TolC
MKCIFFLLCCMIGFGEMPLNAQLLVEYYVRVGLANNQGVRQSEFDLEKSLYALKEAETLYYPNISFQFTYTRAGGGRTVDFPVGDLMNPVYATLNQLTRSASFPQIENQTILLNPNNFYDARFHITMPLINAELSYNRAIKEKQSSVRQIDLTIYKRELVRDIKAAYYRYMQAGDAVGIYQSALALANEAHRVNQSLFANGKVNRTALFRSENEIAKYTAQLKSSKENLHTAQAYCNFLLNLPAGTEIVRDTTLAQMTVGLSKEALDTTQVLPDRSATDQREELNKLALARSINETVKDVHASFFIPKLNVFADIGSQAFDWKFNNKSAYYFAGIAFQWDLFDAGTHKNREAQAEQESHALFAQTEYVRKQLELQLITAHNAHRAAVSLYHASIVQRISADRYYRDIQTLYQNGQALLIELLDAQQQFVAMHLQSSIALYDTHIKIADIERATASFSFK